MLPIWQQWKPAWSPGWQGGQVPAGNPWKDLIFTRAGAKFKDNGNGTATLAPADTPIFGPKGLLIEPAVTNQIIQSNPNTPLWQAQGTPVLTANAGVAPDGTTTATLLTTDNAGNRVYITPGGSGLYTPSLWLKRISTSGTLNLQSSSGPSFGNLNVDLALLGAGWVRVYPGHPATSGLTAWDGGSLVIQGGTGSVSVYLWGVQNEPGAVVHSLVPTTSGAVTCPGDFARLPTVGIPPGDGTSSLNLTLQGSAINGSTILDTRPSGEASGWFLGFIDSGKIRWTASGTGTTNADTGALSWTAGQTYRLRLVRAGPNISLYRDDVLLPMSNSTTQKVVTALGPALIVGANYLAGAFLDGWLSALNLGRIRASQGGG
jgi:hypothetical protein